MASPPIREGRGRPPCESFRPRLRRAERPDALWRQGKTKPFRRRPNAAAPSGSWAWPVELTGVNGLAARTCLVRGSWRLLAACVACSPYLVRGGIAIAGGRCPPTSGHLQAAWIGTGSKSSQRLPSPTHNPTDKMQTQTQHPNNPTFPSSLPSIELEACTCAKAQCMPLFLSPPLPQWP